MDPLSLALRFWKPIAGALLVLAVVLAIGAAKHSYDSARRDEGRAEVQAKFDAYVAAARERATALALAWDEQRQAADAAERELDDERTKRRAATVAEVAALPPDVARAPVPAVALGVLDDAIAASNAAAAAGSAGQPDEAPAAAPADSPVSPGGDGQLGPLIGWAATVIDLYDQCRAQVSGWARFYAGLRGAGGE